MAQYRTNRTAVMQGWTLRAGGPGIFPCYNEHEPWLLLWETKGKQNQKNSLAVKFPS